MKFIAAFIALILVAAGVVSFRFLVAGPGSANDQVVFQVPNGKSFHTIAHNLQEQGLISSELGMRIYAKLTHRGGKVKMGEYALNKGMTPREILSVLTSGKSIEYPITFPEGANIFEMANIISATGLYKGDDFLKMVRDKAVVHEMLGVDLSSLEGYLFPETYHVTRFTPLHDLVANMVNNFKTNYAAAENATTAQKLTPPLPRHELVILASMVEKETGAPQERPMIASIFYNRLKKNMKLQSDPTIIYGIWVDTGKYKNNITKADLTTYNRYSTYSVPRLPFGPIANPGKASLEAVMRPATSEFLYFVSHNDGTHAFAKSYEEHNKNVKTYQLDPHAREGKSWRDLKRGAASSAQPAPKH